MRKRTCSVFFPALCLPLAAILLAATPTSASGPRGASAGPACTTTTSIGYGNAPVAGRIATHGATACFTWNGTSGDGLFADVAITSGSLSLDYDVFSPSGTSECAGPYSNPFTCPLGATGTWTIALSDPGANATGRFNIAAQRLNSAQHCGSISYGPTTTEAKVKVAAGIACLTFSGHSGGVVYTRAVAVKGTITSPGIDVLLGSANGSQVCDFSGATTCTLNATGTQSLLFYSAIGDTGSLNASIQLLTDPADCITLKKHAATTASSIDTKGQVRCFDFAGKKSETVSLTLTGITGDLNPFMDLFNPAGTSVSGGPGEMTTFTLNEPGTWVMLVEDTTGQDTGDFHIALT
jgi:hypothetical protein